MEKYQGVIIEESLGDKKVLEKVKILSTKVEDVVDKHKTPWLKKWTLHVVEIPEGKEEEIAQDISKTLENKHTSWYADFKNTETHYIIFRNKIFKIDRRSKKQYEEATKYGISLGIPSYQVDFAPNVKEWKR
jgi:hypothetical protein